MKKGFLAVLLLGMTGLCFAQTMTLDAAIASAAGEIGGRVEKGTKIAVLNISSSSKAMAEYIIDELSSTLVDDGRLLVVERDQEKLGLARQELNFNDSEEVNNKSAQQIGRMLGAQSIINGSMKKVGSAYRLTLEVLEVETSIKRYSKNFSVRDGQQVKSLMAGSGTIEDFTIVERSGAAALNLAFGAGSFSQKDKFGGILTAAVEAIGVGLFVFGFSRANDMNLFGDEREQAEGITPIGGAVYAAGAVLGAIRAFTFHKPGYIASIADPLKIALVSDQRGDTALQVSYTIHY